MLKPFDQGIPLLAMLDILVRGGGIALIAIWAALLWRSRQSPAAMVGVAMCVSIAAHLCAPLLVEHDRLVFLICLAVSAQGPPLLWLFSRIWFGDRSRIDAQSLGVIFGFAVAPVMQIILFAFGRPFNQPLWFLTCLAMLGFAGSAVWIAWRGRRDDLIESRRIFRLVMVGLLAGFTVWTTVLELAEPSLESTWRGDLISTTGIFIAAFAVSLAMYQFEPRDLFAGPSRRPVQPLREPMVQSPLARRLVALVGHERPYRAEGFSIAALAYQLGEPEYRIRRTINGELGYRNFSAFLAHYRLEEVRAALSDPAQRSVPILTIALDAGFGSLVTFNRAFREAEGETPSEWRARRLADFEPD